MSPIEEKKIKRNIDEALAESVSEITVKNAALNVAFDWAAFDTLDWEKLGKAKEEEIKYVTGHVQQFGYGFNCACKDIDYQEELVKVDEIIVTPATVASPANKAIGALNGTTLIVTVDLLGSTMGGDDWEKALKSVY